MLLVKSNKMDKAKDLYLSGILIADICEMLQVPKEDVKLLAFGVDGTGTDPSSWYHIRTTSSGGGSLTNYDYVKPFVIKSIEKKYLNLLHESVDKLTPEDVATVAKQKDLVGIIEGLDKINRLESGRPTEILDVDVRNWSLKDIRVYNQENNPLYRSSSHSNDSTLEAEFNPLGPAESPPPPSNSSK